jgi:hypothetical protein
MSDLFKNSTFTDLDITTREDKSTLWVFGCSHSFGMGLRKDEKNYGTLLSEKINIPLKLIARSGTSTHFSLRHLINANLNEHDFVVWQLTNAGRFSYKEKNIIAEILLTSRPKQKFIEFFTDDQMYFQQLSFLNIGVNYLRAKKVKFVITSNDNSFSTNGSSATLMDEYTKYSEYCYTPNFQVDYGTDNLHAGPVSHQNICNSLYNHIQYLYE